MFGILLFLENIISSQAATDSALTPNPVTTSGTTLDTTAAASAAIADAMTLNTAVSAGTNAATLATAESASLATSAATDAVTINTTGTSADLIKSPITDAVTIKADATGSSSLATNAQNVFNKPIVNSASMSSSNIGIKIPAVGTQQNLNLGWTTASSQIRGRKIDADFSVVNMAQQDIAKTLYSPTKSLYSATFEVGSFYDAIKESKSTVAAEKAILGRYYGF